MTGTCSLGALIYTVILQKNRFVELYHLVKITILLWIAVKVGSEEVLDRQERPNIAVFN